MSVGRDGHQGWSRAAERGWQRAFGGHAHHAPPKISPLFLRHGEIVTDGKGHTWRANAHGVLEEVYDDAVPTA